MIELALVALVLAGVGFVVRLVRGPTLADRIVGLDGLLTVCVMAIAAYGTLVDQPVYAVVAVVVALVSFVGSATFARFIERKGNR